MFFTHVCACASRHTYIKLHSEYIHHLNFEQYSSVFLCIFMCRNSKRELNDIRFEFQVGKDSAEGIASELVGAGLVDGRDIVVIAANLQKLIDTSGQLRQVTFPLVSA